MKKLIFFLASLLTLASCSSLSSVQQSPSESQQVVETDKAKRYEFDLDKDNYWRYLDLSISKTSQNEYYSLEVTFSGVLSFAYYENVVATFAFQASGTGGVGGVYQTFTATIKAELNAAGCFHRIYSYEYIPENITPTFNGTSLYGYERTMTLFSITGKVLFAI